MDTSRNDESEEAKELGDYLSLEYCNPLMEKIKKKYDAELKEKYGNN
jgi:hypothetical protein